MNETKEPQGLYVYCVAKGGPMRLGRIGIEDKEVYVINHKGLCAVVHECMAKPYDSKDAETVKGWIRRHQEVIDLATERLGTVLPMTFDMIIKGDADRTPRENVLGWLKKEHDNFSAKLSEFKDRQEFGIQIFWNRDLASKKIAAENEEIITLQRALKNETKGKAYFIEQKIESLLKTELEREADGRFKTFYERIKKHTDAIKADKVKKVKGTWMLANLSCLVQKSNLKKLGGELEAIREMDGISVRFTGPWPPYSFVSS